VYQTPLYDLTIDQVMIQELQATGQFEWMSLQTDEDEHSIEMQLPYIAKVMSRYSSRYSLMIRLQWSFQLSGTKGCASGLWAGTRCYGVRDKTGIAR